MDPAALRPAYLTSDRIYLRAPVESDTEHAQAWLDDTFPINAARAKAMLDEEFQRPWQARSRRLIVVRRDGDEVVGGVRIGSGDNMRTCMVDMRMAPWLEDADALRGATLALLAPWLRDDHEVMASRFVIAADHIATIAAAEAAGLVASGRLREWFARGGGRVDALLYEALNPRWEVRDA